MKNIWKYRNFHGRWEIIDSRGEFVQECASASIAKKVVYEHNGWELK